MCMGKKFRHPSKERTLLSCLGARFSSSKVTHDLLEGTSRSLQLMKWGTVEGNTNKTQRTL